MPKPKLGELLSKGRLSGRGLVVEALTSGTSGDSTLDSPLACFLSFLILPYTRDLIALLWGQSKETICREVFLAPPGGGGDTASLGLLSLGLLE